MLASARRAEESLREAQTDLAESVVEGRSEDNKVKIRLTGAFKLDHVHLTAQAVSPERLDRLEDCLNEALRNVLTKAHSLVASRLALAAQELEKTQGKP